MTCFAIGAATVPPWPVVLSTVTAIATRGLCTGANAMNHAWFTAPTSAVPVLPATSMPSSAAAVPVPSSTTLLIIWARALAVPGFITSLCSLGFSRRTTRPSLSRMSRTMCGRIRLPPFAIAAGTSAI